MGAEWVLYILVFLSLYSVSLLFERSFFYKSAQKDIEAFRKGVREAVAAG